MSTNIEHSLSRRSALVRFVTGGLSLALAARSFSTAGQEATPSSSPKVLSNIIERWGDAWASSDSAAAFAALYTNDAIWVDTPTGLQSDPGKVEVFMREFVSQISDIQVTLRSGFRADDHGAAEWDFSFRYTGQLPEAPAGTGQPVTWRGATIFEFAGDQISRSIDYYDNTPFLAALGLLPPSEPAATPTS